MDLTQTTEYRLSIINQKLSNELPYAPMSYTFVAFQLAYISLPTCITTCETVWESL